MQAPITSDSGATRLTIMKAGAVPRLIPRFEPNLHFRPFPVRYFEAVKTSLERASTCIDSARSPIPATTPSANAHDG